MNTSSLTAAAVACGPIPSTSLSQLGNGVLVVINLAVFTAAFFIMASIGWKVAGDLWRNRHRDMQGHPVTIWRGIGLLVTFAGVVRFGVAAAVLWGWNPDDPSWTGVYLDSQRWFDPIAALCGVTAMAMFILSERGMVEQLRKQPFPIDMWASLPMLRRPALIAASSLIAAILIVSLR